MNIKEGYIKFSCKWNKRICNISDMYFHVLNLNRNRLYNLNLIGMCENGIGFGNISMRIPNSNDFYITGSSTGKYSKLSKKHFSLVTDFDFNRNFVDCTGQFKASSESLTHAAVYVSSPKINAVVHVHHFNLWKKLKDKIPTTNPAVAYGTPEMAYEIMRIIQKNETEIVIMGGHEEGILTFGEDLPKAVEVLLSHYQFS